MTEPKLMNVYWLGAERNENQGDDRSMQEQVAHFLKTGENVNPRYFRLLVAQMASLGLIQEDGPRNGRAFRDGVRVVVDDLGVPAGGQMNPREAYFAGVMLRRDAHVAAIANQGFDAVVLGGALTYEAFVSLLVPQLPQDQVRTMWVIGLRNPSPQAHLGPPAYWFDTYARFPIRAELATHRTMHPAGPYLVKVRHNPQHRREGVGHPWRVERKLA